MSVTPADIHHTARLARLAMTEDQAPQYVTNLNNLLTLIGKMQEVDTTAIEPMAHPLEGQEQRLRVDEITEANQRELFQAQAPHVAAGLYIVPKVIE